MAGEGEDRRYFFAVWPDAGIRSALSEWGRTLRVRAPARRVADDNLHITLVFLGELDAPRLAAVREIAGRVPWTGARLVLDRIGHWKRSRIIWAGSRDGCEALTALADALRDGLQRRGFRVDERPFVPHVTLFRKARQRPRWSSRSIDWRIDEFCLVASRLCAEGAHYEVLNRWSAHDDMK